MEEYKDVKVGKTKVYIHKKQHIITEEGDILLLRFSYDKEKCFIRTISLIEPYLDVDGKVGKKYTPLNLIVVGGSEKYEELLGEDK